MKYTKKQSEYIREHYKGISSKELADMFNAEFGTDRTPESINAFKGHYGLKSGWNNHFPKGHTPWNNGTKGQRLTTRNKTSFKPKPVGTIIHKKNGYTWIKDTDGWKSYAVFMYEKYHNYKVTDNDTIRFLDRDITNFSKNNLVRVTKKENAELNRRIPNYDYPELNRTSINILRLRNKVKEIEKT